MASERWQFWVDRGGTFTDVIARAPNGRIVTAKLLSENPEHYRDPAVAAMRQIMDVAEGVPLPAADMRVGTTVGTHFNIAFALVLALRWAEGRDPALIALIRERSLGWFAGDRDCQAWEPGGDEFLSPALSEALLMSRLLSTQDFSSWFNGFLPSLNDGEPASLFTPAIVSDRSDGKIAHLDGLNLSRAWSWRGIATALGPGHPLESLAEKAALSHIEASLPHVAGDYMGEHWLASFALLALAGD